MKNGLVILNVVLLLGCTLSCNNKKSTVDAFEQSLFPQPQEIPLNTQGGYITNVVTGDTLHPLVNSLGDTLKTGVPIPATPKIIHPDSVAKPKVFKIPKNLTTKNAHPNRYKIPKVLTTIPVDKSQLKTIKVGEGNRDFVLLNSTRDTLPTGVPIPAKGKVVKAIQPRPTKALPPATKDAAIANIQYLDVDQGMSSSYVWSMIEDKNGNLWFGTDGGGISMYNGETFVHFTEKEGLSNNIVRSMIEDKNGNLWCGTDGGGISMYNGETFVHFTEKEGLSNNSVKSMIEDKNGNLWFGTDGGGVSMYNGEAFIHFTEKEGLSNNSVKSMIEDKNGNLWFGTDGGGVSKYNGETFVHFTEKEGLSNNIILSMIEDKNGNLWFGSFGSGVSMYNGEAFVHITEKEGLNNNSVVSMIEDKNGNLWFGTFGGGVNMYNGETFVHFTEKEGISYNFVYSMIEDKNGNLWFGTYGGGISKYNGEAFVHFTEKEGLSYNFVYSMIEDKNGNLWFGTYGGGVSKYNGETFVHFTEKEGLSNNIVLSIIEDKNGNLWFGTNGGGVSMYNGETFVHFTEKEGLSDNVVLSMLEDKNGNLWFGTYGGGVSKYNGETFVHFTGKEGLSNNSVRSMIEDKNGNLWFGTYGCGVSKYNGETFVHFTEKEGLNNNYVWSMLEDKNGNLWFGTGGGGISILVLSGVEEYNGETIVHFTEKEGLSNNRVWNILENKNTPINSVGVYVATENGLNYLLRAGDALSLSKGAESVPRANEKRKEKVFFSIQNFGKQDGLKGLDFIQNSALIDSKKRAWWGNGKGLEMLDLNTFKLSEKIPVPRLTQLDINEEFVDYRNISDSLKKEVVFSGVQPFSNYPLNLELPYRKNHLTFYFVAIDWAAPHKIQYSYIMAGLDKGWSQATKETKAEYRNLSYGTYTFKIRAIGESGKWSEPFEYTFTILPPWYRNWWAYTGYALLMALSVWGLVRLQTQRLKQRQKELEQEVTLATKEIRQQKEAVEKQKEIVEKQKEIVEEAHREITDSINYAERIQRSFLATKSILDANLGEYFILYIPRDVVSGDFYWASTLRNGNFALVNGDSTGHGVPGAIMSIANIACLKESVTKGLIEPDEIFNETRRLVIDYLNNDGTREGGKDGMDASMICFDFKASKISIAAAHNPVWLVRGHDLTQFPADKMPIGKFENDRKPFSRAEHDIQKGDVIYTITDGFQDQFGGEKGKKFMVKKLRETLLSMAQLPMQTQHDKLKELFFNWKGDHRQLDDVCIIGVRIG
jgi:ligand-binding sensor domain-containing protein/serine phosphatase RsbU (regulator of sigma subunit)